MIKSYVKKNIFVLGVVAALILSIIFPKPGLYIKNNGILNPLTFIAMFVSGLGLSMSNIKSGLKDYKSIIYSFIAVFAIFPCITFLVFKIFGGADPDMIVGTAILAAQSSTLSAAIIMTMSSGGNMALALVITIINNISAAIVTPVILKILLATNEAIAFDVNTMILKLVIILVLPVVIAQVLRLFIRKYLPKINKFRKITAKTVILCFVMIGGASAASSIGDNMGFLVWAVIFALIMHIVMILISLVYAKISKTDRENATAVSFCSSQKTLPSALLVWGNYFPQYLLAPIVIVAYHVGQLLIDSVLVNIFADKNKKNV